MWIVIVPQVSIVPAAKSFRSAVSEGDVRVFARKLEKHGIGLPSNRLLRLIPPSKKMFCGTSSAGYGHGTSIGPDSLAIAQPSASLAAGSEGPHSAAPSSATETRRPFCHLKMLTTDTEPPFVMSEVIRTSPSTCWPVKPPAPSGPTWSWKNQKPIDVEPFGFGARSCPKYRS